MELRKLSDERLEKNLTELVAKERSLLCVILLHVMEMARRRSYEKSHPTLFEYLTDLLKYSHGSAQRRRDAALLALEVPEMLQAVESGVLNLSQITVAQMGFRAIEKQTKKKVPVGIKQDVLLSIQNKSVAESEIIVSQKLGIKPKHKRKVKHQADGSVRVELIFTESQWQKLLRAKELLSHSVPSGREDELITYMSERVIAYKDKTLPKQKRTFTKTGKASRTKGRTANSEIQPKEIPTGKSEMPTKEIPAGKSKPVATMNSNPVAPPPARATIPTAVQREVFARDKCCQYQYRSTGKCCGSHWQLQIDHIQPIWADGTNDLTNLRVLCAKHNRQLYNEQSGVH
jgi:hypothetical protein